MIRTPSIRTLRRMKDPKVVVLPTAPDRQVRQNFNRSARAERDKVRAEAPWPADRYTDPRMREARDRAKALQDVGRTPELLILLMVLDTLPREQRQTMIEKLAPAAVAGGPARQAVEVIRSTMLNFGEQWDLMRAQEELRIEGAGEGL